MGCQQTNGCVLVVVCGMLLAASQARTVGADLPAGSAPPALGAPHFPSRLHTFVWRNWELVTPDRMAKVLGCKPDEVLAIGRSMGLADPPTVTDDQWRRSYITVMRRNWHLLPYEQMLTLLGWDSDKLAFILKEDDFLFIKLGSLKPKCEPLRYEVPTPQQTERARQIARIVSETFGKDIAPHGEPPFAFVRQLSEVSPTAVPAAAKEETNERLELRYLYSYFALYGDPLAEPETDPYPDGYLQKLAALGVNGVWMQAVLNKLAPSKDFPEFGQGWERRLENLRKLVDRAGTFGIKIYLYLNEPRTMEPAFFERHPGIRGVGGGNQYAMCVSTPAVQRFLSDSLAHVFKQVPNLGGAFTISASENLTNCWSHGGGKDCVRCSKRSPAEVIADTNRAMAEGMWRSSPSAKFIVWDWGWNDAWAEGIITALPKKCWFMSVSEWSLPIERGGVKSSVGEYSLSSVGPGPRATRHWAIAKKCGLRTVAKLQVGNTWEMAAVPYVPVLQLVGEHMRNLATAGLDGVMLGWTLGGYPSPNLEMTRVFSTASPPTVGEAMKQVAEKWYGATSADAVVKAWREFSEAFREYPFNGGLIYCAPHHWGPANLLYTTPTGYKATMVGIPYDDVDGWRTIYPAEVMAGQFEKIATGWWAGLESLRGARGQADPVNAARIDQELRIAEVVYLHCKSVANQVRFVLARRVWASNPPADKAAAARSTMTNIVKEDLGLARRL